MRGVWQRAAAAAHWGAGDPPGAQPRSYAHAAPPAPLPLIPAPCPRPAAAPQVDDLLQSRKVDPKLAMSLAHSVKCADVDGDGSLTVEVGAQQGRMHGGAARRPSYRRAVAAAAPGLHAPLEGSAATLIQFCCTSLLLAAVAACCGCLLQALAAASLLNHRPLCPAWQQPRVPCVAATDQPCAFRSAPAPQELLHVFASEISAKSKAARRKKIIIGLVIFSLLLLAANAGLVSSSRPSGHASSGWSGTPAARPLLLHPG